ncbi:NUDIX hydrolase [Pseudolabrys taiwanensis]|uniref:GDP-mannose pyrophosphatase n=1 Tax=Pseudolabrys taiwanensis TaxID=331696 RepID=A0A345ZY84_9HYPH|nr:NUDIX hydrolase [Pseudolabrys taiwanensis]AXK81881.1 NUDIX hydrolase [Pseudolabrys taiwanensis]
MADKRDLVDRPAGDVAVSAPELLAKGYRTYLRYTLSLPRGGERVKQQRDVLRAGKVVAVLPVDLAREEVVLIRQFRLPAHLANGQGDLIEVVAGGIEAGEQPIDAARRECTEEIGVFPNRLVELFRYFTTPGITDEEVVVFLAAIDAGQTPLRTATDDEHIDVLRVSFDDAIAALGENKMYNGPLLLTLHWLALNRARLPLLLGNA